MTGNQIKQDDLREVEDIGDYMNDQVKIYQEYYHLANQNGDQKKVPRRQTNFLDYLKALEKLSTSDKNELIAMHNDALGTRNREGEAAAKKKLTVKMQAFLNKWFKSQKITGEEMQMLLMLSMIWPDSFKIEYL